MRYLHIDGLRGLMLISMVLSHLGANLSLGLTQSLVFKSVLINDAASGFVFLSGLTVGLVYTRAWTDPNHFHRRGALTSRAFHVFLHHVFLVILVTAIATLGPTTDTSPLILSRYGAEPLVFGVLSLLLVAGGWCLDILPMYVLFLLLTPTALSAATAGRRWAVIAVTAAAWLVGQSSLAADIWHLSGQALGLHQSGIGLGLELNRLSWSALYFSALLFGSAYSRGEFDLSVLKHPRFQSLLLLSLFTIAGLMLLMLLLRRGALVDSIGIFAWLISKRGLGVLALLNFVATAFVVTWLLVAGPTSPLSSMRKLGALLDRLLQWRPLVLLGQHSLPVFTYHLVGVYLFYVLVDVARIDAWTGNLILALGVASLAIPVLFSHHVKARKRRLIATQPAAQLS